MANKKPDFGKGVLLKGVFCDGPVQGLEYETQTLSGITNEKGEFKYRAGETVTFSIGGFVIGSAVGDKRATPADLIIEVGGDVKKIRNQKVTNIARFLQSLDGGGDLEKGVIITDKTRNVVNKYRYKINFDQSEEAFTEDPNIKALFAELGAALRTPAQARNRLRRALYGIKKMTDIRIPTRDGSYLLADVSCPVEDGRYPAVMSLGAYGKAFFRGCICSQKDLLENEELEDKYFEGKPLHIASRMGPPMTQLPSENFELVNTVDWVPKGYAVVRVDGRGVCKTPGTFEQFSLQEAKDYYDAIEWVAKQPWSNGKVGLWGASYYGMNQYNVAQLQPPSLKAMIPIAADVNSYRDYIYVGGGLYNEFNFVAKTTCGEWKGVDWIPIAHANPFDDPAIYGPEGKICISPDMSKVTVPFWSGLGIEGTIHTRGCSEAYILAASQHKKLTIISEPGIHYWTYAREFLESDMAFFDYWLKGIDNGIMEQPPVKMMVRTGYSGYSWQYENEWPIARTRYTKLYLDAAPSLWKGDGKRHDFMRLNPAIPGEERSSTYSAEAEWTVDSRWKYGVSFVTEPMTEDILLAGYPKLVIWVSSTSHDMELHASVRVMDENDMEVPYPIAMSNPTSSRLFPIGFGALKVSHRKLDPDKSRVYRPYHTHLKKDHQPLSPGKAVEAEVELWPTTALIRKGWRLRLDVQPIAGSGIGMKIYDAVDQTYQRGSKNTVYTGLKHQSYLQIPVIPPKK
ncbi:MAG: hypothetical protein A2144_11945 [Chloroflexi bacterium RBG_16_50_9]|nr:MAG: hypothetical protein A2144_11945 [Chloroflexi bacterium RBG_16_50_9]